MDEYMHHIQKFEQTEEDESKNLLAMGFNDDEECKIY
jgi:hypothetical protein